MIGTPRFPMGETGRLLGGSGPVWAVDGHGPAACERGAACAGRPNGGRRWAGRGGR